MKCGNKQAKSRNDVEEPRSPYSSSSSVSFAENQNSNDSLMMNCNDDETSSSAFPGYSSPTSKCSTSAKELTPKGDTPQLQICLSYTITTDSFNSFHSSKVITEVHISISLSVCIILLNTVIWFTI